MKLRPSAPPALLTISLNRAENPVGLVAPTAGNVTMPRELFDAGVSWRMPPVTDATPDGAQLVGSAAEKSLVKRFALVSAGKPAAPTCTETGEPATALRVALPENTGGLVTTRVKLRVAGPPIPLLAETVIG